MRIFLIDPHPIVQLGLCHLLTSLPSPCEVVVSQSACAEEALSAPTEQRSPDTESWNDAYGPLDLIMADPCRSSHQQVRQDVVRHLVDQADGLPVIIFSTSENPRDIRAALAGGASAYVPKSTDVTLIASILHLVHAGGVYVPPCLANRMEELATAQDGIAAPSLIEPMDWAAGTVSTPSDADPPLSIPSTGDAQTLSRNKLPGPLNLLTRRQFQVLQLLAQGLSNADIGEKMSLNLSTVKSHVTGILRTLKVSSRTQAVLLFNRGTSTIQAVDRTPVRAAPP